MAPGSHPVYVTVGGATSNRHAFQIDPAITVRNQTFSTGSSGGNVLGVNSTGSQLAAYTHDVLFENCTFTATSGVIPGYDRGVLTIGEGHTYNITFKNCTITGNWGNGGGYDYGVNAIKIKNEWGCVTHDITFDGCNIGSVSRMSFESVGDTHGATNIALLNCTFEPSGSECISWGSGGDQYSLIDGCLIKGYDNSGGTVNGFALPQYGGAWEANTARYIETRNMTIWCGAASPFNINGVAGVDSKLLFTNVKVDMTSLDPAQVWMPGPYGPRMFSGGNYIRTMWRNCDFNMGNAAHHLYNAGGGSGFGTYNDWTGCTIHGATWNTYPTLWDSGTPLSNILPTFTGSP
jgi:hypothetical protein